MRAGEAASRHATIDMHIQQLQESLGLSWCSSSQTLNFGTELDVICLSQPILPLGLEELRRLRWNRWPERNVYSWILSLSASASRGPWQHDLQLLGFLYMLLCHITYTSEADFLDKLCSLFEKTARNPSCPDPCCAFSPSHPLRRTHQPTLLCLTFGARGRDAKPLRAA